MRCPRTAGPHSGREAVPAQVNLVPVFDKGVLHKVVSWGSIPAVLFAGNAGQPVGLGYGLEFAVVILPAPGYLLNAVLAAVEMAHFMYHGIKRFFNRVIEHFRSNIKLIRSRFLTLPYFRCGAVSIGCLLYTSPSPRD